LPSCCWPSLFGFREQIIKEVAIGKSRGEFNAASILINNGRLISLIFATLSTTIILFSINYLSNKFFDDPNFDEFLYIFSWALIFIVLTKYNTFILIGLGEYKKSVLYDGFYNTLIVLILLAITIFCCDNFNTLLLASIYLSSRVFTYVISEFSVKKIGVYSIRAKIKLRILLEGKEFFYLSVINTITSNIDLIVVGYFLSATDVAIYAVCSRISKITQLITYVISTALSPQIAALFHNNKIIELKSILRKYAIFTFLLSTAFLFIIFLYGSVILNIWGAHFSLNSDSLLMMVIGTSFGFVISPYSNVLTMTGNQSLDLRLNIITSLLYIAYLIVLTKFYGIIGSAIAFGIQIIVLNIIRLHFTLQILNQRDGN
jgi:O-antigen/teichoic acid export membrane protein